MLDRAESQSCSSRSTHPHQPRSAPWRGVNLGGWLLLEPGPAKELFRLHADDAKCEWDLMEALRAKDALHEIERHRQTYLSRADFERIKLSGLNAVRLPFGYWTVLGPAAGEPYHGPALEYIDKAVDWAEEFGLQIVLDLHGAPGGESGDAPCGRDQDAWKWTDWQFDESLRALHVLARRYCGRKHVTGIEVCNEPSRIVPTQILCRFYAHAIATVRQAGMSEDDVAIILPVFQRPKANFAKAWHAFTGGVHKNIAFDFHYYHCFGSRWDGCTLAQQLRAVERHAGELRRLPAVVGEWSLALGRASRGHSVRSQEARAIFAKLQMQSYENASHGWFFWNWNDAHGVEWNFQESMQEGAFKGDAPVLPKWDGRGEDPLEELLNPSPPERDIRIGDTVVLRSYSGHHVTVNSGCETISSSADPRDEAFFTICSHGSSDSNLVLDGSTVRLCTPEGAYLTVDEITGEVLATSDVAFDDAATVFIVHVVDGTSLKHRGAVYFQSLATFNMVHMENGLHALWDHCGDWQRFVVEKKSARCPDMESGGSCSSQSEPCPRSPSPVSTCFDSDSDMSPLKTPYAKRKAVPTRVDGLTKRSRHFSPEKLSDRRDAEMLSLPGSKLRSIRSRSRSRSRSSTASTRCPESPAEPCSEVFSPVS